MRKKSDKGVLMKTTMVGLAFLLLGSSTVSPMKQEIGSQGSGITFEQCCNDRQPGHLPIFRFDGFASYTTAIAASGDAADIYYPTDGSPDIFARLGDSFPVVVVLQGGRTTRGFYSEYAGRIARHGFIVIVPDHIRVFPPGAPVPPAALTEASVLNDAFAHVVAEGTNPGSPIFGLVDGSRLGVTGHSLGGAVALNIIGGICPAGLCTPGYVRPPELKAAALYATNFFSPPPAPPAVMPIDTSAVPVALIQGLNDGRALPARATATYLELEAPRALIEIEGANHYGINDVNNPAGATPDPSPSLISQSEALDRIATWTALFLRAEIWGDPIARFYVYESGGSIDSTVTVTSER